MSKHTSKTIVEMLQRRDVYGQDYNEIARAMQLSRAQVYYTISGTKDFGAKDPTQNEKIFQEKIAVAEELAAVLGDPPEVAPSLRGPGRPKKTSLSPTQQGELENDISEFCKLAQQATSHYGMTARKFLWRCLTSDQSA